MCVVSGQSVLGDDKSPYFEPARECGHFYFAIFTAAAVLPTLDLESGQGVVCCRYLLNMTAAFSLVHSYNP